jgi:hypothetical protein
MVTTVSGLLKLPLELRQHIYHYTLVQNFKSRNIIISVAPRHGHYKLHGLENVQSLVFANRLIHNEILHYCFSRFDFHLCNGAESVLFVVREFYRQIGRKMRKFVKYITIPHFGIDTVFFHPTNMVALFASSQARYMQLLDEMETTFLVLRRFSALEELNFGLDLNEIRQPKACRPWIRRDNDHIHMGPSSNTENRAGIHYQMFDSYLMEAFEEAKYLPVRLKIGIWWERQPEGLSSTELRHVQDNALQQLRVKTAPIQVEFMDTAR